MKYKIKKLKQTCLACPSQFEGKTDDDRPIYIRYRFGYLSIRVGEVGMDIMNAVEGKEIYGKVVGESFDGLMDLEEIIELTGDVIEWKRKK
jgi:uncharacterized Rossmann fold enzyme